MASRPTHEGRKTAAAGAPAPPPGVPLGVLVADDEPAVRNLLGLLLRGRGFEIWLAADGREAVELYRRHRGAIGVVPLDWRMPCLDGPAALRALRALDPAVRCCFLTGQLAAGEEDLLGLGAAAVLQKPCDAGALADVLRRVAEGG